MKKEYLYALISVSLWASTAVLIKLLLEDLNCLQIIMYSSGIATLTLFIIILCTKKLHLIKEYKIKDYLIFFLMGTIGIFGYTYFLYSALIYLPAQEATVINYLWPIMIVMFAVIILKEKLTLTKSLAMILSFLGVVVIITNGNLTNFHLESYYGVSLALLGAITYGLFSVLTKKLKYDKTVSMMFYYLFSTIVSFIIVILFYNIPSLDGSELVGMLWNGIFVSAIAYVMWSLAIGQGSLSKISNIAFLTPFLALIYIYIFLGESISVYSIAGLVIIIFGMLIQNEEKGAK